MDENEFAFLDRVHNTYTVDRSSQTKTMRELIFRTIKPYLDSGQRGIELGCSDGYMTSKIAAAIAELDVVDGSLKFIAEATKRNLRNVKFIHSLFEDFSSKGEYDCAFASYILEHVRDPVQVLRRVHENLLPGGMLFVVVPNARALSRQLARHMGLIKCLEELTENDIGHGHRRVYDRSLLNEHLRSAGFKTISQGGIMLKILADFQLDRLIDEGILSEKHIDALYWMGLEYPDLCGSLFSICQKP